MHQMDTMYLMPELLSRARMCNKSRGKPRPARRIAMSARRTQDPPARG